MNCLKCGREISEEEVFCEECLAEAAEYPINPNAVVLLPRHEKNEPVKKPVRRRMVPLDEQVKSLRRRVTWLTAALVISIALALAMLYPAASWLTTQRYRPGQNYTPIVTTSTTPSEEAAAP